MPKTAIISFIRRGDGYITPSGATELEINDRLFVLTESEESLSEVFSCLNVNNQMQKV
jgi:cell volume regulation protein A